MFGFVWVDGKVGVCIDVVFFGVMRLGVVLDG